MNIKKKKKELSHSHADLAARIELHTAHSSLQPALVLCPTHPEETDRRGFPVSSRHNPLWSGVVFDLESVTDCASAARCPQ